MSNSERVSILSSTYYNSRFFITEAGFHWPVNTSKIVNNEIN